MTTTALMTLLLSQGIVTIFTGYFLWKVLKSPRKSPDNHCDEQETDVS